MIAAASWDGSLVTLPVNGSVSMSQTTNGSMVFSSVNQATMNNQGEVTLSSGAAAPQALSVQALTVQPTILVTNWHANNLNVTNTSRNADTPLSVEAFGPGMPGQEVKPLFPGTPVFLKPMQTCQGTAPAGWMKLSFEFDTSELAVFALIGGPADPLGNNAYVVAVNSLRGNTGPGTSTPAPAGYYGTTSNNQYSYQANWGGSTLFVAYLGSATVDTLPGDEPLPTVKVTLLSL